jgi:hypothetical protein
MSDMDTASADPVFECTRCGECCRGYGGTYVSEKDILAISAFLKVDAGRFVERFCQISGGRPLLAQTGDGYCIFWDQLCTIHPVKPKMCRQWPYLPSILIDFENWRMMASSCPGMRLDASPDRIRQAVCDHLLARD